MIPIKNEPTSDDSNHPQAELTIVENHMKPDESGIIKRNQVKNQNQDEKITTIKKMKKDDFGVKNSTPMGKIIWKKLTFRPELQPLRRTIPKPSILPPNNSSLTSSSPPPTTDTHSSSISAEMALESLNKPISYEDDMNVEGIIGEIREWLSFDLCSQQYFLSQILEVDKRLFDYVIAFPPACFSLSGGQKLFVRMYNWLKMSGYLKMKILSLDESTKRIESEDYSVDRQKPVGACDNQERGVPRELNNAVLNINCPMPSPSPGSTVSHVSSSLSPPTSAQSHSMSVERALKLLNKLTTDNIYLDNKEIARQMREWFTLKICSQAYFAVNVLGTTRNDLHSLLKSPPRFNSMKTRKELFIKMYNWLKLSEDMKKEILSIFEIIDVKSIMFSQGSEIEEEEYECPEEISRKNEASLHSETSSYSGSSLSPNSSTSTTAETFNTLINKPVYYVDTKRISVVVKNWLKKTKATQEWFAMNILGRSTKTLNQCLNMPKDWKDLWQQREVYVKMHNWMCLTEEQRHEIMKVYKAPNM